MKTMLLAELVTANKAHFDYINSHFYLGPLSNEYRRLNRFSSPLLLAAFELGYVEMYQAGSEYETPHWIEGKCMDNIDESALTARAAAIITERQQEAERIKKEGDEARAWLAEHERLTVAKGKTCKVIKGRKIAKGETVVCIGTPTENAFGTILVLVKTATGAMLKTNVENLQVI